MGVWADSCSVSLQLGMLVMHVCSNGCVYNRAEVLPECYRIIGGCAAIPDATDMYLRQSA